MFRTDVVFAFQCAVGYSPCQARPSYFGTHNTSTHILPTASIMSLARFPVGSQMPRACGSLDYEYDSGDDWDDLGNDNDVDLANSTSSSSKGDDDDDDDGDGESSGGSNDSFINDDDSDDSDGFQQNKMLKARRAKLDRLRGKDKLIPSYSGPFENIPLSRHPLKASDLLVIPSGAEQHLTPAAFAAMLRTELALIGVTTHDQLALDKAEQERTAALRNKLAMSVEAVEEMHQIIVRDAKMKDDRVVFELKIKQMCDGVSKTEVLRTLKRFYTRSKGTLLRREMPWEPNDPRLFYKPPPKKTAATPNMTVAGAETAADSVAMSSAGLGGGGDIAAEGSRLAAQVEDETTMPAGYDEDQQQRDDEDDAVVGQKRSRLGDDGDEAFDRIS